MTNFFEEDISDDSESNEIQHLFVDEAGDPTLFDSSGNAIIETNGCSRFFIIGKLEVNDPPALSKMLTELREKLLIDAYFDGVASFQPERQKTALHFHAKDDLSEVRYLVFNLLRDLGKAVRFHAVVCDKKALLKEELERRSQDPRYRYQPDTIYDGLIRSLCSKFHGVASRYEICVAKRGAKDRNQAIRTAIEHAERDFEENFGFSRGGGDAWGITISNPKVTVCLQAVDYFLWAVQRFYEARPHQVTGELMREDRYLKMLWPQIGEIHDHDFGPKQGTHFTSQRPLTLEERFSESVRKKKKP